MQKKNYCITHESYVVGDGFGSCVLVSCPPPEDGMTYEEVLQLEEPSEEELILMDMNAEVLASDFRRKFRFLGYGNLTPCPEEIDIYGEMDQEKHYWYVSPVLTVGKVYEALYVQEFLLDGFNTDISIVDDEGDEATQEIQFFEEVS